MKRLLVGIVAGALALSGALAASSPAQAGPNGPDIETVVFTPKKVVFDADTESLSAKVRVDIPPDWVLTDSYLSICNYNIVSGLYACDDRTLSLSADTRIGDKNDLTFSGDIPNQLFGTLYRGESYAYVYVLYTDPTGLITASADNYYSGYFKSYGAAKVSIAGPSAIKKGSALKLRGVAQCYRGSGYGAPDNGFNDGGFVDVYFRFPGETDQDWVYMGGDSVDPNTGAWRYTNISVGVDGEWQVRYSGSYNFCDDAKSAVKSVKASGAQPSNPKPPPKAATHPSKPRFISGSARSHAAVISWATPRKNGGARIDRYQVHRFNSDFDKSVRASKHSVRFNGLNPAKTYSFYVRAHNRAGWSDWSRIVRVKPRR
jgi:hypothetical protein